MPAPEQCQRLQWWQSRVVLRRLQSSTHNTAVAKSAASGLMTVHAEIQDIMKRADVRRHHELSVRSDAPPTADWRLHTSSVYCYDDPRGLFRTLPTALPSRHVANTPDRVEPHSFLPTTHAALCATEELSRVCVLNMSLLLHAVDEAKSSLSDTSTQSTQIFDKLGDVIARLATNVVDQQQMAMYHRRWSLTQGTSARIRRRLLQDPTDVGVQSILTVKRSHDVQQKQFETIEVDDDEDDDEDEEEDDDVEDESDEHGQGEDAAAVKETSTSKQPVTQEAETPVKLSLADVESVLGVSKNKLLTPQSISSLSSFVNRVSGHLTSDFLSEF